MADVQTFEDTRREAHRMSGDTEDWLRSGWRPEGGWVLNRLKKA